MEHLALIAGLPGSGKTTFMRWLADQKQYLYADMERGGLERDGLRELWESFLSGSDREAFVAELRTRSSKVVLDWNFPPRCLNLVIALQERGCEVWWFEGDRLAARRRFLERGTEPAAAFDAHVDAICTSWQSIAPIVGANIISTIDTDGTFLPHETIFQRMTSGRA